MVGHYGERVSRSERITIDFAEKFDLVATVRGTRDPVVVGPTERWWATNTPEGPGSLRLAHAAGSTVIAEAWGPGTAWMLRQAPRLLGADDDLSGFAPEGKVRDSWRQRPFLLGRTDRLWDTMVGTVFGQKVQVVKAKQSARLLASRFGDRAPGPHQSWILPSEERVAQMAYHDFHELGVERKRAEIVIRVARELLRGSDLTTRTPEQVRTRLEAIRGVGVWTSHLATAAAMGDPDAVPVGDYHLPNTVAWYLAGEPRATDDRMLELLEPYAGHRWRVMRLAKASGGAPKYGPRLSLTGDGLHRGG